MLKFHRRNAEEKIKHAFTERQVAPDLCVLNDKGTRSKTWLMQPTI